MVIFLVLFDSVTLLIVLATIGKEKCLNKCEKAEYAVINNK